MDTDGEEEEPCVMDEEEDEASASDDLPSGMDDSELHLADSAEEGPGAIDDELEEDGDDQVAGAFSDQADDEAYRTDDEDYVSTRARSKQTTRTRTRKRKAKDVLSPAGSGQPMLGATSDTRHATQPSKPSAPSKRKRKTTKRSRTMASPVPPTLPQLDVLVARSTHPEFWRLWEAWTEHVVRFRRRFAHWRHTEVVRLDSWQPVVQPTVSVGLPHCIWSVWRYYDWRTHSTCHAFVVYLHQPVGLDDMRSLTAWAQRQRATYPSQPTSHLVVWSRKFTSHAVKAATQLMATRDNDASSAWHVEFWTDTQLTTPVMSHSLQPDYFYLPVSDVKLLFDRLGVVQLQGMVFQQPVAMHLDLRVGDVVCCRRSSGGAGQDYAYRQVKTPERMFSAPAARGTGQDEYLW